MESNQSHYGACPFQPIIPTPGPSVLGGAPKVNINPVPCLGPQCAAFYAEMCLAGSNQGFALVKRDRNGLPLGGQA